MAGKGDKPRNCFSSDFKKNYDQIKWSKKESLKASETKKNKQKVRYSY